MEIPWSKKDLQEASCKPGWYREEVRNYDEENAILDDSRITLYSSLTTNATVAILHDIIRFTKIYLELS